VIDISLQSQPSTEHIFFVSLRFVRELCSNRAILALYVDDSDTAEIYETLTKLVEDLDVDMKARLFTR